MKRLIIYDLDGTLVDTEEDIYLAACHMLDTMGAPALERSEISRYVGKGLHYLVGKCLRTQDSKKIEKGAKHYREYYRTHMMDHSHLYEGALDLLDYFRERAQMVLTNKPNPFAHQMLEALGVSGYFQEIIAGNSEHPKKPDPSAIRFLMEKGPWSADETLMVGDSLIDIETAQNAGIEVAVLSHGFAGENELKSRNPDLLVAGFGELLNKIRQKGW